MKIEGLNSSVKIKPITNQIKEQDVNKQQNFQKGDEGNNDNAVYRIKIDQLQKMLDEVNKTLQVSNFKLQYNYHEESNRIGIKVLDKETDEVIREVPPEQVLEMVAKIKEAVGLVIDQYI